MSKKTSAHLQVYLDGKCVYDERITDIGTTPGLSIKETAHEADNGEIVPVKAVITAQLSRCPNDHDGTEPCC